MDQPDFIVYSFIENSTGLKRVNERQAPDRPALFLLAHEHHQTFIYEYF